MKTTACRSGARVFRTILVHNGHGIKGTSDDKPIRSGGWLCQGTSQAVAAGHSLAIRGKRFPFVNKCVPQTWRPSPLSLLLSLTTLLTCLGQGLQGQRKTISNLFCNPHSQTSTPSNNQSFVACHDRLTANVKQQRNSSCKRHTLTAQNNCQHLSSAKLVI